MRPRRTPVIGVTGAADGLGAALLARLAARPDAPLLVALDAEPGTAAGPPDVEWRTAGVRDPLLEQRLQGITTLVHLDVSWDVAEPSEQRRARNVRGTALLFEAAAAAGVDRVVVTTSSEVYGPAAGTALPLPDAHPCASEPDDAALIGDHVEVERLAAHAQLIGLAVTLLRPATLVGGALGAAYDGQVLRQLGGPRLLAVRGVEPLWQLCHVEDLLAALELAALGTVTGALAVGGDGALTQSRVEAIAGRRRLELPAAVALSTAARLHRVGVTASSPRELDHLLAPVVVASDGLRAAGWKPRWSNEDALRAHLVERGRDGRAVAVTAAGATAAGATVALVGTAALVRAARRRRRRG